jgi:hypothetical protein
MKLAFEGKIADRQLKVTAVSDGKSMVRRFDALGEGKAEGKAVPEKLTELFTGYLNRAGLFVAVESSLDGQGPQGFEALKLSGFKTTGKEKVGDVQAVVIEYQIALPGLAGSKGSAVCKVWLDAQTQLPLKRTVEIRRDGEVRSRATETFSQWEIDPKLSEETFTLPK